MTFSRIRPLGWGFGNKLSSAEENQMDINLSKAVDKTGDTIAGTETFASGSKIVMKSGSEFKAEFGATTNFYGYTYLKSGARLSFDPGGLIEGTPTLNGILTVDGMGHSIATSAGGRFVLGDNDWVEFSTPRTHSVILPFTNLNPRTTLGWTYDISLLAPLPVLSNQGVGGGGGFDCILSPLHHGATLSSVDVWFSVAPGHAAMPSGLPSIELTRIGPLVDGGLAVGGSPVALSTTSRQYYSSASLLAYQSKEHKMTYVCNQNNVIDTTQYLYGLSVNDEFGTNARLGNGYYYCVLNYSNITNMRFP